MYATPLTRFIHPKLFIPKEKEKMEKYVPVVVIKELSETDKILAALKNNGINTAEITFRMIHMAETGAHKVI